MRIITGLLAVIAPVLLIGSPPVMAQPVEALPDPQLQSRVADAQVDVKQARFAMDSATKNLKAIQDTLERKFEQSPDWIAASQKLTDAKAALASATAAAQAALASNPDFVAAKARLEADQDALAKAKSDGDGPEVIVPLATARVTDATKFKNIQTDAFNVDPKIKSAKSDADAAQAAVDKLHSDFIDGLANDPKWSQANADAESKKSIWITAQAKLDAAQEALTADAAAKEQQYNQEMADWHRRHPLTVGPQGYGHHN